ncbi:hypothetical protein [Propionivibrio sp.]
MGRPIVILRDACQALIEYADEGQHGFALLMQGNAHWANVPSIQMLPLL